MKVSSSLGAVGQVLRWIRIPQYVALGLSPSYNEVSVVLELGSGRRRIDIVRNNVVAALRPLTVGVMLESASGGIDAEHRECRMCFSRQQESKALGVIHLRLFRAMEFGTRSFCLFHVAGSRNDCLPTLVRPIQDLYERWRTLRHREANPFNFQLTHRDLKALFVFYIRPRPVYLVSVEYQGQINMFPMDLVGPTDSPWFSFALRTTSPAVELIKQAGRFAAAEVDVTFKSHAYELGRQHTRASLDVGSLAFETTLSPEFGLRVPTASLGVREVEVEHAIDVGSHCVFLTTVMSYTPSEGCSDALQLFHTHGSYAEIRGATGQAV